MDNGIYNSLCSLIYRFNNAHNLTNNMANANTVGFKADYIIASQYITKDVHDNNAMPDDIKTNMDPKPGGLKPTGRPLDFAITGGVGNVFIINTPLGVRYTRNGSFQINSDNVLVTPEGYAVISADGAQVVFEEGDGDPTVDSEGNVYSDNGELKGRIGVVNFPNLKLLRKAGENLFISDVEGQESTDYRVMQGVLEESNVSPIQTLTALIEVEREFELSTDLMNKIYALNSRASSVISKQPGSM